MSETGADAADVVVAYLRAGDSGDWPRLEACLAEDVVTHSPGGTTSLGVEAQRAAWAAARRGLQDLTHEVRSLLVSGATVAARIVVTGTHVGPFLGIPATGARLHVDLALFVRLERGRIAELWEIVDSGAGLQQLGVLPHMPLAPGGR